MKYMFDISKGNFSRIFRDRKIRLYYIFIILLIFISTAILALKVTDKTYLYSIGDITESEIRVPRDIHYVKDLETIAEKKRVAQSVSLVFDKDSNVLDEKLKIVDYLLNNVVKTLEENPPIGTDDLTFQVASLKSRLPKSLQYNDRILHSFLKYKNSKFLKRSFSKILIYLYDYKGMGILDQPYKNSLEITNNNISVRNINSPDPSDEISGVIDDLITIDKVKGRIYSICYSVAPYLPADILRAVSSVIRSNLKPNLSFNPEETKRRIDEKVKQTKPVTGLLKKGQTIVREGDTITNDALHKINIINKHAQTSHVNLILGLIFLQLIFLAILSFFSFRYEKYYFPDKKGIYVIFSLLLFFILYSFFVDAFELSSTSKISYILLMPIPFVTMMVSILYNIYLSLFCGLYLVFFALMMVGADAQTVIIAFSTAIMGTFININVERRSDFFRGGLILGLVNTFIIIAVSYIENVPGKIIITNIQLAIANGILNSIFVLGIFPVYEHVFDITTKFKLLELSDLNANIFKKMLLNAPGTYNHSLLVSTMAEAACKEIGANYMLARVGAFYHDIGKIPDSGLYIENSVSDPRAKELSPAGYSKLIISHVSKGVRIAREHSLPESIIDFIREHHGNSIMTFFFHQALENASANGNEEIKKSDFQYPGPKPHSKETAIVMIADSIEAASRSLNNPTREKIDGMVRKIIYNKLNDGDLDESELSMIELKQVQNVFLKILYGIFHTRIQYPDIDRVKKMEMKLVSEKSSNLSND